MWDLYQNSDNRYLAVSAWGNCVASSGRTLESPFAKRLVLLGWQIVPIGDSRASFYIAYEHSREHIRAIRDNIPVEHRLLVTGEPRAVLPDQFRSKVRRQYGKVFIPTELQKVTGLEVMHGGSGLPAWDEIELNLKRCFQHSRQPNSFAILNENKVSLVLGSKYALRKNVIRAIAKTSRVIHVGGRFWDDGFWANAQKHFQATLFSISSRTWPSPSVVTCPLPSNHRFIRLEGPVESAVTFLSNFEFAIVIENDPTYVSEKFFNACMAGCVPLYSGPDLRPFGIPDDCYIELPARIRDLPNFLDQLPNLDLARKRESIRDFLNEPTTYVRWAHESLYERIATMVDIELRNLSISRNPGLAHG